MISEKNGQLFVSGAMSFQTVGSLLSEGKFWVTAADRVLNLSEVGAVDSSALAVLLSWTRTARAAGRKLQIVEPPAACVSLARLYGVSPILFPIEPGSEHSAQH
jgi:phospholipid transport system transporter-binding protein